MHLQSIEIVEIVNMVVIREYNLSQKKVCMIKYEFKGTILQPYKTQNPCKMSTNGLPLSTVIF